jgi:hypothetical protein
MNRDESVTLRVTKPEKADLEAAATLTGQPPGTLAALYVREGVNNPNPTIIIRALRVLVWVNSGAFWGSAAN